jgi:hypothetical protein
VCFSKSALLFEAGQEFGIHSQQLSLKTVKEANIMGLESNATLFAQIVDLLLLILIVVGVLTIISKARSFKKNTCNKIEKMDSELKEIKRMLEGKKL